MPTPYQWRPPNFLSSQYPERSTPLLPEPPGPEAVPQVGEQPSVEELERLAELGLIDPRLAENLRQQEGLDAQAMTPLPEGRQAGRTFVAANPLEHVAALGSRAGALYRRSKLGVERENILGRKKKGYETAYDLWLRSQDASAPSNLGF